MSAYIVLIIYIHAYTALAEVQVEFAIEEKRQKYQMQE